MALAPIRTREFSLPRGSSAASQLNSIGFYVTHSLLWYFLGLQESTVPPRSPREYVSDGLNDLFAAADFVVYYKLVCLAQARAAAITLGMISIGENRYAV